MNIFTAVVMVPAYTDFKQHDICTGDDNDDNIEPLDMHQPPYFHYGLYTTMRQAVQGHGGEAMGSRAKYRALAAADQDAVIEFLKTLQVLPPGTKDLVVDENYKAKAWPPQR